MGVCVLGSLSWGSVSRGISVQGGWVSVQGGLCPGASLSRGSLSRWSLSREGSLSRGPMSKGISVLGVSVWEGGYLFGDLCLGVSVQEVSVKGGVTVQGGVAVKGGVTVLGGVAVQGGGLCLGVSVWGGGSLSRGDLSREQND